MNSAFELKKRRELYLTFIPLTLLLVGLFLRPSLMRPICSNPSPQCSPETAVLLDWERYAFEPGGPGTLETADALQWVGATSALLLPLFAATIRVVMLGNPISGILLAASADWLVYLQATLWNLGINEWVRLGVQRPRPYVYLREQIEPARYSDYTSFYSGHTSFVSLSFAFVFFFLWQLLPNGFVRYCSLLLGGIVWLTATSVTGWMRIEASVHFGMDVIVGGITGLLIATALASAHRPNMKRNSR